jgi:PAS domain S-box-containing protein
VEELQAAKAALSAKNEELAAMQEKLETAKEELELRVARRTAELHALNQRLETVLQSLPVAVWIADEKGKILETNEMAGLVWGSDGTIPTQISEFGDYKGWWANTGEPVKAEDWAIARALSEGEISMGEIIDIERFDGSYGTILVSATPIYDDQGQRVGAVAASQDITHQRELEKRARLAAEEARAHADELDAIFNAISDSVVVFDDQNVLQKANPAAIQTYGFDPNGMLQADLIQKLNLRYPDGGPVPTHRLPTQLAMRDEGVHEERLLLTNAKNQDFLVDISASPLKGINGSLIGTVVIWRDVTERERLLAQIARERDKLRTLIDSITDEVWFCDAEGEVSLVNAAALQGLGVEGMEEILRPLPSLLPELEIYFSEGNRREIEQAPLLRSLRGEIIEGEEEILYQKSTGKRMYRQVNSAPLRSENGQILGAVAVVRDITTRKEAEEALYKAHEELEQRVRERTQELALANQELMAEINERVWAEQALKESEERYRLIIETAEEGVWVIDQGGKILFANEKMAQILGYTVEELEGSFLAVFAADDFREIAASEMERRRQGSRAHYDFCFRHKDGHEVWTIVASTPIFDPSGNFQGAMGMVTDITERKRAEETLRESEERYRLLVETVKEYAIITLDPEGYVTSWNAGAENIKGYKAEEIIGQHFSRFYTPERIAERLPWKALKKAEAEGRVVMEDWRVRKDGTRFWALVTITPLWDENGELRGFSKVVRDMTTRKQAEEAIQRQAGFVKLLQDIAVAANQATSIEQALQYALDRICAHTGWQIGHAFLHDEKDDQNLISTGLWHLAEGARFEAFREASQKTSFSRGKGLPGKVFFAHQPVWLKDVSVSRVFIRRKIARQCEIKTGVAFPILVKEQVAGVIEFYTDREVPEDEQLMEVMAHIGTQLGRVVERKRAEEDLRQSELRFRTIFEGAPLGIELVDLNGRLLECNPAICDILGYSEQELRKLPFARIADPPNPPAFERDEEALDPVGSLPAPNPVRLFENLRKGQLDFYRVEQQFSRNYGSPVWGRLSVSLVRDGKSNAQYAIGMLEDISERKQMEADLVEIKRRQMEGRELERLYLAQELHDGPVQDLYALSFTLKAYLDGLPEEVEKEPADDMQKNVQQVVHTLRDICGELRPPTLAPFGLEKSIRSHAEAFQEAHPDLAIGLELTHDGQTLTESVRLALFRIYQESLNNIVRHANAHNVMIRFHLDSKKAVLSVEDDGKGFNVPSRWVDLAREGHLGLVGSAERAEAIGGTYHVESAPGQGTTIRVVVPLHLEKTGKQTD